MIPQNGVQDATSLPLPPDILALIVLFSLLVIGAFVFAMMTFLRAGKSDAQTRRRRGVVAKDPLDPQRPSEPASDEPPSTDPIS